MKILVTGAAGFVGKNLVCALLNLRDGKDRTRALPIDEVYAYDVDTPEARLSEYCRDCDFVFHLAGVNRPQRQEEFREGNVDFTARLLSELTRAGNRCPVMLSSSIQATLVGRYGEGEYGKSKRAGEELLFEYGERTGAPVLVYRFPNLFGKWCRPNYNSAVATFCHNVAHGLPVRVDDERTELVLLYIDDLVAELLDALEGRAHRCEYDGLSPVEDAQGRYCFVPTTHTVTLGRIVALLEAFSDQSRTLVIPTIAPGSFEKKLYSTYLSYLPYERVSVPLEKRQDARGSFTELIKTESCGQFSVNVSLPGVTKGEHWHHSKWEFFIVVSGRARIRQRSLHSTEVLEWLVDGERPEAVQMLPGFTHSIENLSDTEPLVTLMWANECFDPAHPDTYSEKVDL